jgi:hypothetical protein
MNVHDEILLLVQEDRLLILNNAPAEYQVIAKAIAAFAANNRVRERSLNLAPLTAITFPAIVMVGSSPIFYKIAVTAELSNAVECGTYPKNKTWVFQYIPDTPVTVYEMENWKMRPLANRVEILACLEAFKQFL